MVNTEPHHLAMKSSSGKQIKPFLCLVFHLDEAARAITGGTGDDAKGFLRVVDGQV